MSLNRILNRPMFRREALRKGHLKPIKARVGMSIGPNRPPVPMVIPQPGQGVTVGSPYNYGLINVKQPTGFQRFTRGARNLGRGIFSIPGIVGYGAGDTVAQAMGINDPVGRTIGGMGGAYAATKALPGLASLPALYSAGLMAGPAYLMYAGSKELDRIKKMSPAERAKHFEKSQRFGMSYLDDETFEEQFGKIDSKKLDEIVKKPKETIVKPGGGRVNLRPEQKESIDLATTPGNVTILGKEKDKVIDTAKLAENALPPQISDRGKSMDFMSGAMPPPDADTPIVEKEEKDTTDKDVAGGKGTADQDAIDASSPFKAQLDLARQIAKEMRVGRTSNANLVFMSNLASGLLTGTTRKAGLGGALEVFGAALGPAVNNMVMVKMKEDEIEQNLLGRALEFSTDFLKAQNQAFEMPDTSEIGVIQMTNKAGRIVNVPGRILKDGTKQMATGAADPNTGLYNYISVDPGLNFIANKDMNKETLEIAKSIAGKYAAVNLINRSLGIIEKGDAQAGVTGAIGLYGGRLTEALGDVLNFAKIGGDSKREIKASGKAVFEIEKNKAAIALVASGEFEDKQSALKYLNTNLGTFDKNYNNSLRSAKKRLKDGDALDYERLAINETVLVYKLANSLKAKDRLTQKDIEMAKGLVKVFPLLRGERNVIASLTATAETILDDIKQQERLYERAGGSSQYLLNERKAYGLLPDSMTIDTMTDFDSEKFRMLEKKIGELTEEDFQRIFPPELFK